MKGFDLEALKKIINYVEIPIIISGGAGSKEDVLEAFKLDVSAVSISSLFHFTETTPREIKDFLNVNNIPVRI
jgi:cyclase